MDKNQKKSGSKGFFASRKFKYGSVATMFTAFFIAVVILLNAIVSAVDSKYQLYFDMTDDQLFSISEGTNEMVDRQLQEYRATHGEDPQIKISFLAARDQLEADEQRKWVITLAESYAEQYDQITVEYREDLKAHPENYSHYLELGYKIDVNTIIVSNVKETGSFRIMTFDSCLVYDEAGTTVWAFQGEMKFNAAILYITNQRSPVVTFTTGHGEIVPSALTEILTNCGFTLEYVDLTKDDINPQSRMLFMCSPQKDLTYSEDDTVVTEYTKISEYLNKYRSMVVIGSPNTPKLPILDELLAAWGMELVRNQVVMDDVSSHMTGNKFLYVEYPKSENIAAALTNSLTALSSPPRSICYQSAPINILFEGDGELTGVEAVLTSSEHSYVEEVTADGTVVKDGPFNLMAVSTRFTIIDNVDTYSHLLLIGSEHFTETNTYREQFGNTDIIYNMIRLLSNEYVPMETNYKVLEDYTIDMDNGEVYFYGIVTAAVIPVMIFSMGIVVYIKRKHM